MADLGLTAFLDLKLPCPTSNCHGYARGFHHQADENPFSTTWRWNLPNNPQHHDTVTASYEIWAKLISEAKESTGDLHIADDLLELLQQIPGLYAHHSKGFSILDQPYPQLKYALEWVTTTDLACERPIKRTYYYQTLGVLRPLAWEYSDASENTVPWPGRQADQMKHLSRLILAWAYILSSQWVEILNTAGKRRS